MARYGVSVADLSEIIEHAVGGEPLTITVDGRNRYSVNVRYPRDVRDDVEKLRRLLVPVNPASAEMGGMERTGFDLRRILQCRFSLAQAEMGGMREGWMSSPSAGGGLRLPDRPWAPQGEMSRMSGEGLTLEILLVVYT